MMKMNISLTLLCVNKIFACVDIIYTFEPSNKCHL